jgi:hypothetical protein
MAADKNTMLGEIAKINAVDGFDPTPFAVDFTDLGSGEVRKRLPVMIQMAWFRMKYPEGKISVSTEPGKDCFVATARVYPSYRDPADCYLAEASASRGEAPEKPSVSPREWAQTAAIGIALRNAGFGLQFAMAGEDFEAVAPNKLTGVSEAPTELVTPTPEVYEVVTANPGPTEEELLEQAMATPCPITKFSGKTLREVLTIDPGALRWLATKYQGDESIRAAAQRICEYAVQQAS